MANECVSPFSFYESRCFGSDLARFFAESERVNHLLLGIQEPSAEYAIKIDACLLDKDSLVEVDREKHLYLYPKSIFFQKGKVRFRFATEELLKTFLAETEIMLEVKCTTLYENDFYVSKGVNVIELPSDYDVLPMEAQTRSISEEDSFNYTKGAIIGYCRGIITSRSYEETAAITALTNLKNNLVGLHTQIMVDDNYVPSLSMKGDITTTEELYNKASYRKTKNFKVLGLLYEDLIDKASLRYSEIKARKTRGTVKREEELKSSISQCEVEIRKIELDSNIAGLYDELDHIKRMEVENGRISGQQRKYFPKGSPEYARKQEIKKAIGEFKKNNKQYLALTNRLKGLQDQLFLLYAGATEYDSAIDTISNQISDVIANILKDVEVSAKPATVDFKCFESYSNGDIKINTRIFGEAEQEYYNILLKTILESPLKELRPASDVDMLNLLKVSMNRYKEQGISFSSEQGQRIRSILLNYWFYKHHDPRGKVIISDEFPLINNVIAFLLKGSDFAQIERYAANKGIQNKEFALMLMGGFVGFSSLPRTMTTGIYQSINQYLPCQTLLSGISIYSE